jgi:hypothetical protein
MLPPVYQLLANTSAVVAIVGDRIAGHGEVPQDTTRPYITYFTVTGQPFDQISGAPCSDRDSEQIDCWHDTRPGIRKLAFAVRDALDAAGYHNRVVVNTREGVGTTRMYRVAIQADFITNR